ERVLAGTEIASVESAQGQEIVNSWVVVKHLNPKIHLNPNILERISSIRTGGKIPVDKFDDALNKQLGQILNSADEIKANKILDRLQEAHVNEKHFDDIVERLENPLYQDKLVKDLKENPDWFETFDDIIHHPGKYWDILEDGTTPFSAPLAKWGQGFWWKKLREKAKLFEEIDPKIPGSGAAQSRFANSLELDLDNIGTQITFEVGGVRTRVDFIARGNDGLIHIGEAKFSTKLKNWLTDWVGSLTKNQSDAFPSIISKNSDIEIKVTDPKKIEYIEETLGIVKNEQGKYIIPKDEIGTFKLLGSAADDASVVSKVVELIK
ncbi:hypothetical protein, partial [Portibacter lacus]